MKVSEIVHILETTERSRKLGKKFIPLLVGHSGIGKSEICQQWVDTKRATVNPKYGFLDLRIAYFEGPDLVGYPREKDGRQITALPDFWPTEGEGLILLEEPNRGNDYIMNCLMQLLTDFKIHQYTLPKGWIIAAAINPETEQYSVNSMDTALKNRFVIFNLEFSMSDFIKYIEKKKWNENLVNFIKKGYWKYKTPDLIGTGTYVSPRSLEQMDVVMSSGIDVDSEKFNPMCLSILGREIGGEFGAFCQKDVAVLASDILKNEEAALKQLKKQNKVYRGDKIKLTIDSILEAYGGLSANKNQINEKQLVKIAECMPQDQAFNLIIGCVRVEWDKTTEIKDSSNYIRRVKEFRERNPEIEAIFKEYDENESQA